MGVNKFPLGTSSLISPQSSEIAQIVHNIIHKFGVGEPHGQDKEMKASRFQGGVRRSSGINYEILKMIMTFGYYKHLLHWKNVLMVLK